MGFIERLADRMNQALPGYVAHNEMRATHSSGRGIEFKHQGAPRQGGVTLLLYKEKGSWRFPLMKRPVYDGIHSGQISLPGGKKEDSDQDLIDTAVRETMEEMGVAFQRQQVIGVLSELYIVASHFNILPIVAVLDSKPKIVADRREVQEVIIGSLDELLSPGTSKIKEIQVRGYDISAPFFEIQSETVWGATAMILNEFLIIARDVSNK